MLTLGWYTKTKFVFFKYGGILRGFHTKIMDFDGSMR